MYKENLPLDIRNAHTFSSPLTPSVVCLLSASVQAEFTVLGRGSTPAAMQRSTQRPLFRVQNLFSRYSLFALQITKKARIGSAVEMLIYKKTSIGANLRIFINSQTI